MLGECGSGWDSLIEPLIRKAAEIGVTVTQVKEKYGSLRFYWDPPADDDLTNNEIGEFEDMVSAAETRSRHVCEMCGERGMLLTKNRWYKTLCKFHAQDLG